MNLVVCMKQILDPEIPARDFRIDRRRKEAEPGGANLVANIFCENALETALQLRDVAGGRISVLSFGPESAEDVLRKSLARRADDAYLVVNDGPPHPNPLAVAGTLAAAIDKVGPVDVVMVGRESGDWGSGQTGGLLAEELGLPFVGFVDTIEPATPQSPQLTLRRQTESGWEMIEAQLPLVVSITNCEGNVPRIPKTRDVMQSYRRPLTKWAPAELDLKPNEHESAYAEIIDLDIPQRKAACEFVTGDSLDEKITKLARRVADVVRAI